MHHRIADALATGGANGDDGRAARIALHYERGGDPRSAAAYFDRAAIHAERRSAYRESAAYVRAALAQSAAADDPTAAAAQGGLQLRLAGLLSLVESYGAPAVGEALAAARDAFHACGSPRGLFMAELGLGRYELARGHYDVAAAYIDRALGLTESTLAPLRAVACCWAGFAAALRAELEHAAAAFEEGLAAPESPGLLRDMDAHRLMLSQSAIVLAVRGDLRAGEQRAAAALERARANARPGDLTQALLLETERATFLRAPDVGRVAAAETITMKREAGLPSFLVLARFYEALFDDGRPAVRITAMHDAITERRRLGDRWHESLLLTLVAELELRAGDVASARASIDAAAAHVARSGERHYQAEVQRVQGEISRIAGGPDGAVDGGRLLHEARATARAQGARLWELRAATSLASHTRDGRAMADLAHIVGVFPPGSVSSDLRRARNVLAAADDR